MQYVVKIGQSACQTLYIFDIFYTLNICGLYSDIVIWEIRSKGEMKVIGGTGYVGRIWNQ